MTRRIPEFPPLKKLALQLLARGPMTYGPDGWRSPLADVAFNQHTLTFLAGCGWAHVAGITAEGTLEGAMKLRELEERIAA